MRKSPNIVILNPDQMRWDYASCYGHPFINTQHLDRLAAMGTRFEQAFTSCPMCGPSRTSLLTGLYPMEHGVRNYAGDYSQSKPSALRVLGELYDLENDPHEITNLYADPAHQSIRSELQQRLTRRMLCRGQAPEDLPQGELSYATKS